MVINTSGWRIIERGWAYREIEDDVPGLADLRYHGVHIQLTRCKKDKRDGKIIYWVDSFSHPELKDQAVEVCPKDGESKIVDSVENRLSAAKGVLKHLFDEPTWEEVYASARNVI